MGWVCVLTRSRGTDNFKTAFQRIICNTSRSAKRLYAKPPDVIQRPGGIMEQLSVFLSQCSESITLPRNGWTNTACDVYTA